MASIIYIISSKASESAFGFFEFLRPYIPEFPCIKQQGTITITEEQAWLHHWALVGVTSLRPRAFLGCVRDRFMAQYGASRLPLAACHPVLLALKRVV